MPLSKKKILIADNSTDFLHQIKEHEHAHLFQIHTCLKGMDCLEKIKKFKPDLIIVEFMLPEVHGIEILHAVKKNPDLKDTGVIITSHHSMFSNHTSAIKMGASYFLEKPFSVSHLFTQISSFFKGTLKPSTTPEKALCAHGQPEAPLIKLGSPSYIKFWGTRGSNPVAGAEYVRFGGNTPSLEIRSGDDLLIIDAGSGIRALGQVIAQEARKKIHILLSHTHWDHLLGLPFFYPVHQPNREVHIWAPIGFEKSTKELIADILAYPYFPVAFDDIRSDLIFNDLRDSQVVDFGSIRISTHYAFHPGPTLCFKIEVDGKKIGYVTDNEFLLGCHLKASQIEKKDSLFTPYESLINFLKGCDTLILEAQYTPEEYTSRVGWGHSSLYNASFLIKKANIKHWIVTHHDPRHTDDFLLEKQQLHMKVLEEINHKCLVQFAFDDMTIPLK